MSSSKASKRIPVQGLKGWHLGQWQPALAGLHTPRPRRREPLWSLTPLSQLLAFPQDLPCGTVGRPSWQISSLPLPRVFPPFSSPPLTWEIGFQGRGNRSGEAPGGHIRSSAAGGFQTSSPALRIMTNSKKNLSFLIVHLFTYLFSGCVCVDDAHTHVNAYRCAIVCTCRCEELVLSFYCVGPGDWVQVVRLGSKRLCLQSHLSNLMYAVHGNSCCMGSLGHD